MDTSALAIVLNECNNQLITQANQRNKIEKIVDDIFDELIEFVEDYNFYNDSKIEIEIWRKLLLINHNDQLKTYIERYDNLHKNFANLNYHFIVDIDSPNDTTPLIQATNAIYLLKYRKQIVEDLMKNINKNRKTKCCGKTLNDCSMHHKHYDFYNIIQDRINDMNQNSCKFCRPLWNNYGLYNCEICNLKWKLFYRCFYQYICRTSDIMADRKANCLCFYNDYSSDEIRNAGLDDRTIERSFTYFKRLYDVENESKWDEDDFFEYYGSSEEMEENNISFATRLEDVIE